MERDHRAMAMEAEAEAEADALREKLRHAKEEREGLREYLADVHVREHKAAVEGARAEGWRAGAEACAAGCLGVPAGPSARPDIAVVDCARRCRAIAAKGPPGPAPEQPSAAAAAPHCASTKGPRGYEVRCEREAGHDGPHFARGAVPWRDAPTAEAPDGWVSREGDPPCARCGHDAEVHDTDVKDRGPWCNLCHCDRYVPREVVERGAKQPAGEDDAGRMARALVTRALVTLDSGHDDVVTIAGWAVYGLEGDSDRAQIQSSVAAALRPLLRARDEEAARLRDSRTAEAIEQHAMLARAAAERQYAQLNDRARDVDARLCTTIAERDAARAELATMREECGPVLGLLTAAADPAAGPRTWTPDQMRVLADGLRDALRAAEGKGE